MKDRCVLIMNECDEYSSSLSLNKTYENDAQLEFDVTDLSWTVHSDKNQILFPLHVKTTGSMPLTIESC